MSKRVATLIDVLVGLALGAAFGWLAGALVRSDNAPFFIALGALVGMWSGLVWARVLRPLVLAVIGLLALLLIAVSVYAATRPFPGSAPGADRGRIARPAARRPDPRPGRHPVQLAEGGRLPALHDALCRRASRLRYRRDL